MKKRIFYIWFLIVLLLCNGVCTFATESEENGEDFFEDTINDEGYYPFQAFADRTIPGISVDASVEEGVFPSGTTMNVMTVSSDMKKQIEETTNELFNDTQKVIELIAIDINFSNNNQIINPKDGEVVHLIVCVDSIAEGKKHNVLCFKDDNRIEIIQATEKVSTNLNDTDGATTDQKVIFSFDIKESSTYAIVEIEDEATITDNSEFNQNEVAETGTSDEQNEVAETGTSVEQNEVAKTETSVEQNEVAKTETSVEQNKVEETGTSVEQNEVAETGISVEQNEVEETETSVEQNKVEETENSVEQKEVKKAETLDKHKKTNKSETLTEQNNEKETKATIEQNEKKNILVHIIWNDVDNNDGKRPESVSIEILGNGKKVDETFVTKKDDWKFSFENLPKFQDGKEIVYTIKQKAIKGYETEIYGFDVTNTHTLETIMVEGVIMWDDSSNKDRIRPTSTSVELINNSETITVSKESNWKYSFGPLLKYKSGEEIDYKIKESQVKGYVPKHYGFNITYIHKAGTVNKSDSDSISSPKVGDRNDILLWIIVVILCISAILSLIVIRRKK